MLNYLLYLTLRLAAALLPAIPVRLAYGLASLAATIAYHLVGSARRGISANIATAFPSLPPAERTRLAKGAFGTDAQNWVDTLRIPTLDAARLEESVEVSGWHHIQEAVEQRKGLILITLHLGNFDLVGQLVAARGLDLTVPVEHMKPPQLFEFLTGRRESQGIHIVPLERAPRALLRALSRGGIVGIMPDRFVAGKTLQVDLFGQPVRLPRGPASLIRLSGAPALVAVGVRAGPGKYRGFVEPLEVVRTGNAESDDAENMRRIALAMEGFVRRFPEQWLAFGSLWRPSERQDAPATIGQQPKAAV